MIHYLLAFLEAYEGKSDEKRLGRRCEKHAQNVVLEKQSVRSDGSYFRLETWLADSWEARNRVFRISLCLVNISFLFEGVTAVYGTVTLLS